MVMLQAIPEHVGPGNVQEQEDENFCNLSSEHEALVYGDHFLIRWGNLGVSQAHQFPGFKMNVEGAFVAKLDAVANPTCGKGRIVTSPPVNDGPGKGAVPFLHGIVVPLLRVDGNRYVEERYLPLSGVKDTQASLNESVWERDYGEMLASFVHYTYEVTSGKYLFGDLQGIRQPDGRGAILFDPVLHKSGIPTDKRRAVCDFGDYAFKNFVKKHTCIKYCTRLGLSPLDTAPKLERRRSKRVASKVKDE